MPSGVKREAMAAAETISPPATPTTGTARSGTA